MSVHDYFYTQEYARLTQFDVCADSPKVLHMGNFGEEKIGRFGEQGAIHLFSPAECFFLESVLAIHTAYLQYFPSISWDQLIHWFFTPPKFSHIQYSILEQLASFLVMDGK